MGLSDQQQEFYENAVAVTKGEIEELDRQIEEELASVKERLAELQAAKKAALQMYDAACLRLGVPNELADEDDGSAGSADLGT